MKRQTKFVSKCKLAAAHGYNYVAKFHHKENGIKFYEYTEIQNILAIGIWNKIKTEITEQINLPTNTIYFCKLNKLWEKELIT
jgi:hypothetical protein